MGIGSYYKFNKITDTYMNNTYGAKFYSYYYDLNSQEKIVANATGENNNKTVFRSPIDGNEVRARIFVNQTTGQVNAVNLYNQDQYQTFCCSYEGENFASICDYNKEDCQNLLNRKEDPAVELQNEQIEEDQTEEYRR